MKRPFIIGVGGVKSDSGKTTIASALLKALTCKTDASNQSSITEKSFLLSKKRWGAIKYTNTAFYSSVIDDPVILDEHGKDTQRFIEAGAEMVLWVQSPAEDIHEIMPLALDRLYHLDGIIIEGNSAVEFAKPDVIVLVSIGGSPEIKPSAWKMIENSTIVIMSQDSPLIEHTQMFNNCKVINNWDFQVTPENDIIIQEVIFYMDMLASKKRVVELLIERSVDKRILCSEARRIAEDAGLPYSEVGKLADELQIKIRNCELGCF